ncbi:MAG: hypothetical protein IJO60_03775 [Agathobacter sp.]|nr:hypothetical protein [Agathobacter sp.]
MKKIFVLKVVAITLALLMCFSPSASILASEGEILSTTETVLNKDVVPTEMSVEISPEDYKNEESIVLYVDEETGERVVVDIKKNSENDGISLLEYNPGSWSGGMVPSGSYSFYPHIENPRYLNGEIGFWVDASLYPVKMTNAYNPVIRAGLLTISDVQTSIIKSSASNNKPAKATMNWTASGNVNGVQIGTTVCYLSFEINANGNIRTSWNY